MLRRNGSKGAVLLALIGMVLLAACSGAAPQAPAATNAPAGEATAAPAAEATTAPAAEATAPAAEATAPAEEPSAASDLSGEISFYPQNYYNPEARPEAAAAMEALVASYTTANPGVSVELVPYVGDSNQYRPWLLTRLAAGQAPNITWEQYSDRNNERAEVWVPLTEYLEQPNPYVAAGQPGSERWADLFPDYVLAQIRAGDGEIYEVAVDWVETGLFYNKALFEQIGVTPDWANFSEFVDDCSAIKAAGVDPVGVFMTPEWSTYQWLDDVFFSSAFADVGTEWYLEKYNIPGREFRRLNSEEFAKAVYEGKFSVSDPRFDVYLNLIKKFSDNCIMQGFAGGVTQPDVQRLFVEGKVSMIWLATADAVALGEDLSFDYGLTYLPPITKVDNEFALHEDKSYRVGGPSGPGQYGITQASAQAGVLEEALDFLMYLTAPQNFQPVYDSYPSQVPMIAGVEASELAQQFQFVSGLHERLIGDPIARLSPQFGTEHNRLFQQFMLGEIDAETLKSQYQPLLEQGAADACANNESWDWCNS